MSFDCVFCFFFKQKTAYEMRISDWSSDVCSSDLHYRKSQRPKKPAGLVPGFEGRLYVVAILQLLGGTPGVSSADPDRASVAQLLGVEQIGRASCRERVCQYV